MNVNDVNAGSSCCNAYNVDVRSPTIDILDLFRVENGIFHNEQFNIEHNVINGTMLYVSGTYANLTNAI